MNYFKFIRNWILESTARTVTGVLTMLVIIAGLGTLAHAATSYDVANEQQMYLDTSINQTTTSITLSAPILNGSTWTFATTTGSILRIRSGAYREDIYDSSATVDSITKKITLNGVIRNICPNTFRTIVSCGNGRNWGKGAIVELTQDARLFNLKANIDRSNTFSAPISFSGSGSFKVPVFANTTARDQAIPSPSNGMIVYSTADAILYQYIGGSWTNFASGTVSAASELVSGKVQISTLAALQGLNSTGSTASLNVVPVKWVVKNGSGTITAGRIPQLNQNGVLSSSFFNASNSGVLVTKTGTGLSVIKTTLSGAFMRTNANGSWVVTTAALTKAFYITANQKLLSNGADQNFPASFPIGANTASSGSTFEFRAAGTGATAGSSVKYKIKIGSTTACASTEQNAAPSFWSVYGVLTVWGQGAGAKARIDCTLSAGSTVNNNSGSTLTFDTTTANALNVTYTTNASQAGTYSYLTTFFVKQSQ